MHMIRGILQNCNSNIKDQITVYHDKYNNEKVWTIVRITKMWLMWHQDMKWANAIRKNGTKRLAWNRVDTNFQFVKNHNIYEAQWRKVQ